MIIDDVSTSIVDLPTKIRAYTIALFDGRYCIVLNARMDRETMLHAYQHELKHIAQGDYCKFNVDSIEQSAHSI